MSRPPVIFGYVALPAENQALRVALKVGNSLFYALDGATAVHDDGLHVTQSLS